jgi:hypothetical protein
VKQIKTTKEHIEQVHIQRLTLARTHDDGSIFYKEALDSGYFGDSPQPRPISAAPAYVVSPQTSMHDWSQEKRRDSSASPVSAITVLPSYPLSVRKKPPPLSLQPSPDEFSGRHNDISVTNFVTAGGSYLPGTYLAPLPSPLSGRSYISDSSEATSGWVSPLEAYFSRPVSPILSSAPRPTSYLPRLQFPEQIAQTGLFMSTIPDSVGRAESIVASIVNSETASIPSLPSTEHRQLRDVSSTPTFCPSRIGGPRTIFPRGNEDDLPGPSQKRNTSWRRCHAPPKPHVAEMAQLDENSQWKSDSTAPQSSVTNTRLVSVYQSRALGIFPAEPTETKAPARPRIPSSIYSVKAPMLYEEASHLSNVLSNSVQASEPRRKSYTSSSRRSSRTTNYTARSGDELATNLSNPSADSGKRRSREQDHSNYDPSDLHSRGSVQGWTLNFDKLPPVSNSVSTPENLFTLSETPSLISHRHRPLPNRFLEPKFRDKTLKRHRPSRSKDSIGDLYDAYFQPSGLP